MRTQVVYLGLKVIRNSDLVISFNHTLYVQYLSIMDSICSNHMNSMNERCWKQFVTKLHFWRTVLLPVVYDLKTLYRSKECASGHWSDTREDLMTSLWGWWKQYGRFKFLLHLSFIEYLTTHFLWTPTFLREDTLPFMHVKW